MASDSVLNRNQPVPIPSLESIFSENLFNYYKTVEDAQKAATLEQINSGSVITPYWHTTGLPSRDDPLKQTSALGYAITPKSPDPTMRWDEENQQWVAGRQKGWTGGVGDVMMTVIPALVGGGIGGMASGAVGGGTSGAIVGGATAGGSQAILTGQSGSDVGKATLGGAVAGGIGSTSGGDPYGYGTSVGGKAGTAATTAGILSAAQGQTLEQQFRNAGIAGASSAAGGSLEESTGSPASRQFGSTIASLGLRELWQDPELRDASDYYNDLISQYQANRSSYDQPMVDATEFQNLQSLSPDSPLLAMFQQQDQDMPQKRGRAGGSGQFSDEDDQIKQSSGTDTYIA